MAFTLPPLPYAPDELAPHLSAETLEYHHGKHHNAYVTKANELTNDEKSNDDLEPMILEASGPLFNQLAQHWNHSFYWSCMAPDGGGEPTGELADAIDSAFGSLSELKDKLKAEAVGHFGSGWAWLVHDGSGLVVTSTHDADLPLKHGQKALLTIDVWEHAYYIDYRNVRPDYVSTFLDKLVNWDFVAENLKGV
ncbi:MAG TPA: superoxide dismutase [Acidimicrobiales bacterium]|nr:superoxide dismutase [Acidimicrobiales bacterium]